MPPEELTVAVNVTEVPKVLGLSEEVTADVVVESPTPNDWET